MDISQDENLNREDTAVSEMPETADIAPEEESKGEANAAMPEAELTPEEMKTEFDAFVRWMSLAAAFIVFVFLGVMAVMYVGKLQETTRKEASMNESDDIEPTETVSVSGVICEVNQTTVTLYEAVEGNRYTFDLAGVKRITDAYGMNIPIHDILVGTVAEVRYFAQNNRVELFRISPRCETVSGVSGLVFPADDAEQILTVNGKDYTYDSELLLTYHGQTFAKSALTPGMVSTLSVLDGHIYSMSVVCGEGTVRLMSIPSDYYGSTLTFTPELGPEMHIPINSGTSSSFAVTEGICHYSVENEEGTWLAGGTLYVPGEGKNVVLTLLPLEQGFGTIRFESNVSTAKIVIDGKEYPCDTEFSLPYGEYEATVEAKGYTAPSIKVTVSQPYQVYVANMNALRSYLVLLSRFQGVVVTIGDEEPIVLNGKEVRVPLLPGTYRIRAEKEGYEPLITNVEIRANEADKILFFTDFKLIIVEESKVESEPDSEIESSESSEPAEESAESNKESEPVSEES